MSTKTDKRSVVTDALETLGNCPIPDDSGRDAIHLAVEPVVAAEKMLPGDHVGLLSDGRASRRASKFVGIVDPFIRDTVQEGQHFWLVLYPRTITSLRHVWSHPDFPEDSATMKAQIDAEQWLRNFGNSLGLEFSELLDAARDYIKHGEYLNHGPRFEGEYVPDEFWDHYEVFTGEKVDHDDRGSFFSCAC